MAFSRTSRCLGIGNSWILWYDQVANGSSYSVIKIKSIKVLRFFLIQQRYNKNSVKQFKIQLSKSRLHKADNRFWIILFENSILESRKTSFKIIINIKKEETFSKRNKRNPINSLDHIREEEIGLRFEEVGQVALTPNFKDRFRWGCFWRGFRSWENWW